MFRVQGLNSLKGRYIGDDVGNTGFGVLGLNSGGLYRGDEFTKWWWVLLLYERNPRSWQLISVPNDSK